MTSLTDLSAAIIDGTSSKPSNRFTMECSEIADGVAMVESFSNVVALRSDDGLVLFDTSMEVFADQVMGALRSWSADPVHTVVYTHGHIDHVGGAAAIVAEAERAGRPTPHIVAHRAVPERFDRYRLTRGYNGWINARQFGGTGLTGPTDGKPVFPGRFVEPTVTYEHTLSLDPGGLDMVLHHSRGETDDHTWTWLPDHNAVAVGDLFIWCFPNAGNPQKVQRYPGDWAAALRRMLSLRPELLLPAHGLPVAGADRIALVLGDVAGVLESLVTQTIGAMNAGLNLDAVLAEVSVDPELLDRPWLAPIYDEPEFVVRNIWRQFGGWYDGTPSRLKPAGDAALSSELATLAGGVDRLVARARQLHDAGSDADLRLASHLVDAACLADPDNPEAAEVARVVYETRRLHESSLMAKGIFGAAAAQAAERAAAPAEQPANGLSGDTDSP